MEYVSPFDERVREPVAHAPRPEDLRGRTVALLDINKARGAETVRVAKPSFSRPATAEQIAEIAGRAELVVEALAD